MLVLSRKPEQSLVIDGGIKITVLGVRGNQIRLGIEAPDDVRVYREELITLGRAFAQPSDEVSPLEMATVAEGLPAPIRRVRELSA